MSDGLHLKIEHDFLAISALLDSAHGDTERIRQQYEALRTVISQHFGQVVAMHDTPSLPGRLDREIAYLKTRAGITVNTPENRCEQCWTLRWNDTGPCRGCQWGAFPAPPPPTTEPA